MSTQRSHKGALIHARQATSRFLFFTCLFPKAYSTATYVARKARSYPSLPGRAGTHQVPPRRRQFAGAAGLSRGSWQRPRVDEADHGNRCPSAHRPTDLGCQQHEPLRSGPGELRAPLPREAAPLRSRLPGCGLPAAAKGTGRHKRRCKQFGHSVCWDGKEPFRQRRNLTVSAAARGRRAGWRGGARDRTGPIGRAKYASCRSFSHEANPRFLPAHRVQPLGKASGCAVQPSASKAVPAAAAAFNDGATAASAAASSRAHRVAA